MKIILVKDNWILPGKILFKENDEYKSGTLDMDEKDICLIEYEQKAILKNYDLTFDPKCKECNIAAKNQLNTIGKYCIK